MAPPLRQLTPDRLQIREGGGAISVFGLPFFAAGIFLMLAAAGIVPMSNPGEVSQLAWPLLLLMGIVFTAVGGTLVFGRSWTTVDAAERTVTKQLGLIVPLRTQTYPLDAYVAVTLGFVEGDSDSADRFPVSLKGREVADLKLCSFTAFSDSRACTVAVAQLARLPVEDATTDHPVRLAPDEADLGLQQRLRRDPAPRAASRPAAARSDVSRDADEVRIEIPSPAAHPIALVAGLLPIGIPVLVAPALAAFFRQTRTPQGIGWVFIGFLVLFCGILPVVRFVNTGLRSRRGRTIVVASPRGIRIQERGAWRTRTIASFDGSDIVDLDYSTRESTSSSARRAAEQSVLESSGSSSAAVGPRTERFIAALVRFVKGRGLVVKTRTGLTRFGQGLEDDEARYLHALIRNALSGR